MNTRGDALALAVVLSSGDETTLGPSDSALCAAALRAFARSSRRERIAKAIRLPSLAAAAVIGAMTVSYGGGVMTALTNISTAGVMQAERADEVQESVLKDVPIDGSAAGSEVAVIRPNG